jgi:O-antigen/teichoic acid export membrane protein
LTKAIKTSSVPSATPRLSLRANFSWVFVGNVIYATSQWGMLVSLAKLGSAEMVGQFALGLAVAAPITMFAGLKMREVQATDARQDYLFGDYLGIRLTTSALALLLIVIVAMVMNYPLETRLVIIAVGLSKSIESISDVFYGLLQAQERMDRIAKSLMIRGPLSLVALTIGVYLTGSVFWGVMGLVLVWALVLFLYDLRSGFWIMDKIQQAQALFPDTNRRKETLRPRWHFQTMVGLFWLTLPLGFVELLCSLQDSISRFFVDKHLGASLLGIFAALAYFGRAGDLVAHALGHSAIPRLSKYFVQKDAASFQLLMVRLAALGVGLGVMGVFVAWWLGAPIVALVYKPEYVRQDVFVVLMLAAGLNYVAKFMIYVLTAARYLHPQMWLETGVTVTLIVCSALLVPVYGLNGAAWALVIACGLEAVGALALSLWATSTLNKGATE